MLSTVLFCKRQGLFAIDRREKLCYSEPIFEEDLQFYLGGFRWKIPFFLVDILFRVYYYINQKRT